LNTITIDYVDDDAEEGIPFEYRERRKQTDHMTMYKNKVFFVRIIKLKAEDSNNDSDEV